jgi:hypothetical protein
MSVKRCRRTGHRSRNATGHPKVPGLGPLGLLLVVLRVRGTWPGVPATWGRRRGTNEQGLAIRVKLAGGDPTSAAKQRDSYVLHWQMASLLEREGDAGARHHRQVAHDILAGMVAKGFHVSPSDLAHLNQLRQKLGG